MNKFTDGQPLALAPSRANGSIWVFLAVVYNHRLLIQKVREFVQRLSPLDRRRPKVRNLAQSFNRSDISSNRTALLEKMVFRLLAPPGYEL